MQDLEIIKSYYEPKLKEFKEDYKVLGWETKEAQMKRFEILKDNVDLNGKKVLDVGCGLGNLFEFLEANDISVDYTGVDILEQMIIKAEQKNTGGNFLCIDIFKEKVFPDGFFDVIYASGIFNLKMSDNMAFLKKALTVFLTLSNDMVVFNLLNEKSDDKEDKYFYYNQDHIKKALQDLSVLLEKICFVENYLLNDFTVIIKK